MKKSGNKITWITERRKVSDLVPFKDNPRRLTDKQAKDLQKSLGKFDLAEIPAINTDNTILAGNQRVALLMQEGRGDDEIDVRVPSRKLTTKEAQEYNVRSNRNTGEWDFDILANTLEVEELVEWGFEGEELGVGDETGWSDPSELGEGAGGGEARIVITVSDVWVNDLRRALVGVCEQYHGRMS